MTSEHPARLASQRSMSAVQRGAREEWLALFAADAIVEDPIGVSFLDPDGRGQSGKEAIAAFWDRAIRGNRVEFDIHHSYAAGNEVANTGTITTTVPDGTKAAVEGTFIYKVNTEGRIVSLRAFWEVDKMTVTRPDQQPPEGGQRTPPR
jgi:steroid delta-isomerase